MASICNDEAACFGVHGGLGQKVLSLSGRQTPGGMLGGVAGLGVQIQQRCE